MPACMPACMDACPPAPARLHACQCGHTLPSHPPVTAPPVPGCRSFSVAAQLVAVLTAWPHIRPICTNSFFTHPSTKAGTHSIYQLISMLCRPVLLPISPIVQPDAAAECMTVISWLQLTCGLVLPLLLELGVAARLFQVHQQQRRQAGVPAQRGCHVAVYDLAWALRWEDHAMPWGLLLWLVLAMSFDWCAFVCAALAIHGQQAAG